MKFSANENYLLLKRKIQYFSVVSKEQILKNTLHQTTPNDEEQIFSYEICLVSNRIFYRLVMYITSFVRGLNSEE
jgi:hypothetical protein